MKSYNGGLLRLVSFTQHNVFEVHSCHCLYWYFVPFYSWTIIHFMAIPLFLSIRSLDEFLDCFQALVIMNNSSMNIHMWEYVFFVRVKLLGHMVNLTFKRNKLFSK